MNKKNKLIKNTLIFTIGMIGSKLVSFILIPLYTNILSNSEYGIGELVFTSAELVRPLISLSIFNGFLRFGLSDDYDKKEVLKVSTIIFFVGSILCIIATPLLGLYSPLANWKWYVCAFVIATFANKNALIYLKISDRNKEYAIFSIIQALTLTCLNILFLLILKMELKGYLLANIMAPLAIAAFVFAKNHAWNELKLSKWKKNIAKEMISYSIPFIFNDLSWWLIHASDKYMLQGLIGSSALGIYTAAAKIPLFINVIASVFTQAWDISAVQEYEKENDKTFYRDVFDKFTCALIGIAAIFVLICKPFMSVYVGKAFIESWKFVPLLLIGTLLSVLASFAGSLIVATKKSTSIMSSTLIAAIVNIVFNYYFIPRLGIMGAVIATVVAYLLLAIIRFNSLKKVASISFNWRKSILSGILLLFQTIVVALDMNYAWIISVIVVGAIFVAFLTEVREIFGDIQTLLKRMIKAKTNNN